MERIKEIFGADAVIKKSYGVYILETKRGSTCVGSNNRKEAINTVANRYETFLKNKESIVETIRQDIANDKNVKLLDIDFIRDGFYLGWFYAVLQVGDKVFKHIETNFNGYLFDLIKGKHEPRYRNFTAGGLEDKEVDYTFYDVGFSATSVLYKVRER
jgi:hypothetical protein